MRLYGLIFALKKKINACLHVWMYKYMFIFVHIYKIISICLYVFIYMHVLYIHYDVCVVYIYIYILFVKIIMWFIYVSFYANPYNIMHVDSIMFIEFFQHMACFLFDVRHENVIWITRNLKGFLKFKKIKKLK